MDACRFHKAAKDGFLDLLAEANRKELNSRDDDGMTPALWAAYTGHLDALRLIVGRGGDPDKCDYYGNTCLHCASGKGHIDCVSFLLNFGVNMWAMDNDFHTAKDVAVLNQRNEVLRLLDQVESKHALVNKKLVQRLKEKSVYDVEKRIKQYNKMQMKASKRAEKEERERLSSAVEGQKQSFRRDSRSNDVLKFSDIVKSDKKDSFSKKPTFSDRRKKCVVFRPGDIIRRDDDSETSSQAPTLLTRSDSHTTEYRDDYVKSSDSHPTEYRDDYVKSSDEGTSSPDHPSRNASDTQSHSSEDTNSDALHTADSGIGEELHDSSFSIFDRPGFGTMAFRCPGVNLPKLRSASPGCTSNSRSGLQSRNQRSASPGCTSNSRSGFQSRNQKNVSFAINDSIGSASSLARRHITWEDELDECDDADDDASEDEDIYDEEHEDCEVEDPLTVLMAAMGLTEYLPIFQAEQIDLEALSLLNEEDLKTLGMPLGPRKKLCKAIQDRLNVLKEPGAIKDSKL